MATADEQIRITDRVKKRLDSRRREGESYNDVLARLLGETTDSDFHDGFGLLSDAEGEWIMPAPAYAETIVGVGNYPDGDVDEAIAALGWGEIAAVDEGLVETAARITDEVGPRGPYLDGVDTLVAAVGREWGAPVVSADGDLTHEATGRVVDLETYR